MSQPDASNLTRVNELEVEVAALREELRELRGREEERKEAEGREKEAVAFTLSDRPGVQDRILVRGSRGR